MTRHGPSPQTKRHLQPASSMDWREANGRVAENLGGFVPCRKLGSRRMRPAQGALVCCGGRPRSAKRQAPNACRGPLSRARRTARQCGHGRLRSTARAQPDSPAAPSCRARQQAGRDGRSRRQAGGPNRTRRGGRHVNRRHACLLGHPLRQATCRPLAFRGTGAGPSVARHV